MAPSLFNGQFGEALKESFDRIRFGGQTYGEQRVYYINLQEIKGLKFGTRTPVNYFDSFYNAELFLRAHGTYSVKITDPLKFYGEVIPKNTDHVEMDEINEQYLNEYMEAFQTAINQMSADGIRISFVASKGRELGRYMANVMDEEWNQLRGMEIQAVGIGSISYDEESQKLINLRNRGAMLSDPSIREGYVQGQIAEGLKRPAPPAAAGRIHGHGDRNAERWKLHGRSLSSQHKTDGDDEPGKKRDVRPERREFQGGMPGAGPNAGGGRTGLPGRPDLRRGSVNTGKFCPECGSPRPAPAAWTCACGAVNTGKFCSECGRPRQ